MLRALTFLLALLMCIEPTFAKYEASNNDAAPIVLYGKTSTGVVTPVQVDAGGALVVGGSGTLKQSYYGRGTFNTIVNTIQIGGPSCDTDSQNTQYCGHWDQDGKLVLSKRALPQGAWTSYRYDGTGGRDDIEITPLAPNDEVHNTIAIAVDANDKIHVAYDHHDYALKYRMSSAVRDVSDLTAELSMLGTNETQVTYPAFVHDYVNEKLYFTFRDGQSRDGDLYFYYYDAVGLDWESPAGLTAGKLVNGKTASPDANLYLHGIPKFDSQGRLWFAGTWRRTETTYTEEHQHDVVVFYWDGSAFKTYSGNAQTVPITPTNDTPALTIAYTPDKGLGIQGDIAIDGDDNVLVAFSYNNLTTNTRQLHNLVWNGSTWTDRTLTTARNNTEVYKSGVLCDKDSNRCFTLFFSSSYNESQGIVVLESSDLYATWKEYFLSYEDAPYWSLNYDHTNWRVNKKLSFMVGEHNELSDGLTNRYILENSFNTDPGTLWMVDWDPNSSARLYTSGLIKNGNMSLAGLVYAKRAVATDTLLSRDLIFHNARTNKVSGFTNLTIDDGVVAIGGKSALLTGLTFDGTGDYVDFGFNMARDPMTIIVDFKPTSLAAAAMMLSDFGIAGNRGWDFHVTAAGELGFQNTDNNTNLLTTLSTNASLSAGTRYNVAMVKNGTGVTFYKNGSALTDDGTAVYAGVLGSKNKPEFGSYGSGAGNPLTGVMYSVKIYDRELTATELASENSGVNVPGLIHHWNFVEGSGTTLHDIVSQLHGTIKGTGSWSLTNTTGLSGTGNLYVDQGLRVITGNVGIGSLTPGVKLDVQGTIRAPSTGWNIGIGTASPTRVCITNTTWTACP